MSLVLLGLHKARMQGGKKDHVKKMNNYRNIFLVPLYVESSACWSVKWEILTVMEFFFS